MLCLINYECTNCRHLMKYRDVLDDDDNSKVITDPHCDLGMDILHKTPCESRKGKRP